MTDEDARRVGKYLAEGWAPAACVVAGLLARRGMGEVMRAGAERTLQHLFDVHCTGPELAAHYELTCDGSMDALVKDALFDTYRNGDASVS